jgi:outer membrane protein OmpA-like peptidoglycan-associated protein
MNLNPFDDPFKVGFSVNTSNIFQRPRSGAVSRPKKPEPKPESEPEPVADNGEQEEAAQEEEAPKEKVVLKNPVWEVEDVGFNEETDISVEAELPESQKHKTKVDFELFAKIPEGDDPVGGKESISKAQGAIEGGKAKGKIPVYIPQYKDEDGNLMTKVEYYFTAKHSASDLLEDNSKTKVVDHMADRLIQSHILQDVTFATDKSFLSPKNAPALMSMTARIKEWKEKHPDGKMAIFGHTDAVGKEDYNKKLSERRANSVHAFLIKDTAVWKSLYNEEKWGLSSTQELLKHLGHDPGPIDGQNGTKTKEAVKAFQTKQGMTATGEADEATRDALYKAFIDSCNKETLAAKDFDVIDGKAFAGCSEFNLAEKTQGACEKNRRVAVYLLKSNKNFPIQYPCKQGDIAPCQKQKGRKGERRTAGFGCLFYDQLVLEVPNPADEKPKTPVSNVRWDAEAAHCGDDLKLQADSSLPDGTELTAKLKTAKEPLEELKAKVAGGKVEWPWKVKGVGFAEGEDKQPLKEIEVIVEIDHEGVNYPPEKSVKIKKFVEAKPEEFSDSHQWGTVTKYTVKGHFFQGVEGSKAKVTLKKKVLKTWGATYVTVKPAGITDAGGGFPWAGMRWAKCPKGSMTPNEYWDKGKWNKIDYAFGGEFGTLPIVKTGEKYHWVHSQSNEYPGTFPEYDWATYQGKRDTWIKDSNKRWTGVHALKRKACASPQDKPCCSYEVELDFTMEKVEAYGDEVICLAPGPLRSNAGLMFYDDSRIPMCAHEVGHLVGQPDEYDGGAVNTAVNGDGAKNGLDSTTLMGGNLADPNNKIKVRHYQNFAVQMRKLYKSNGGKDEEWVVSAKGEGA